MVAVGKSKIQITSGLADGTEAGLGGSHILLKISFRDQAPLQGKGGKEGLIILTVVRNLYKPTPGPHGCGSQQRSLLCVPPSSTCSTGVEDEAAPWWCLPVLCLWGVALTTTPHFLKNHSCHNCLFCFKSPGLQLLIRGCTILSPQSSYTLAFSDVHLNPGGLA